jgi:hypothetical protein
MIAPCGNDCGECPRYQATFSENPLSLAYAANLWFRLGFLDHVADNDEIACRGCPPPNPCRYEIVACAEAKNAATCGACGELHGCARIAEALARTERYTITLRSKCTRVEYAILDRAFFRKRENLARLDGLLRRHGGDGSMAAPSIQQGACTCPRRPQRRNRRRNTP